MPFNFKSGLFHLIWRIYLYYLLMFILSGAKNGAVYLSLHLVSTFYALIVLLWTVKGVHFLDVVTCMRCRLQRSWLVQRTLILNGRCQRILLSCNLRINRLTYACFYLSTRPTFQIISRKHHCYCSFNSPD